MVISCWYKTEIEKIKMVMVETIIPMEKYAEDVYIHEGKIAHCIDGMRENHGEDKRH